MDSMKTAQYMDTLHTTASQEEFLKRHGFQADQWSHATFMVKQRQKATQQRMRNLRRQHVDILVTGKCGIPTSTPAGNGPLRCQPTKAGAMDAMKSAAACYITEGSRRTDGGQSKLQCCDHRHGGHCVDLAAQNDAKDSDVSSGHTPNLDHHHTRTLHGPELTRTATTANTATTKKTPTKKKTTPTRRQRGQ